jgi:hypothetical protein
MKKIVVIVAIIIFLIPAFSSAKTWVYRTPLGITIMASQKVILQYEEYWGLAWDDIDWDKIEEIFVYLDDAHVDAGHGKSADPDRIKITIKYWKYKIHGDEPFPGKPRIDCGNCWCQAYYNIGWSIGMNLGLDSGQGDRAFCDTPLTHELNHLILFKMKNKCKWLGELDHEFCPGYDIALPKLLCP